jgi:hypothetical protein
MGSIGSTRIVYGNAEVIEEGNIGGGNLSGTTDYKYAAEGEDIEAPVAETESITILTRKRKSFDVIPMISGGAVAYLAHNKFIGKKHTWAYALGGFALGYVAGTFISKAAYKG